MYTVLIINDFVLVTELLFNGSCHSKIYRESVYNFRSCFSNNDDPQISLMNFRFVLLHQSGTGSDLGLGKLDSCPWASKTRDIMCDTTRQSYKHLDYYESSSGIISVGILAYCIALFTSAYRIAYLNR